MERKVFLCLDCQAIFYDGENCRCKKVYTASFLSKLGIGNKHAEGVHGSIFHVSENNSVGQLQSLNFSVAFSSSAYVEIQLQAEKLQTISNGSNSYLKAQEEEQPDVPVMKSSQQNTMFDLSFHPRNLVSLKGNNEDSLSSDCLVGVQSQTSDTKQETSNYSSVPVFSSAARELQNDIGYSSLTKSMVHNDMIKPVLYEQEGLQGRRFSGEPSSGEYCATTVENNRYFLFNTVFCRLESHEGLYERNNVLCTNIPDSNCISKNLYFLDMQRDEAHHLQSTPQVIPQTCGIRGNKLSDNDVPLVPESDEYPLAGTSHGNVEENFVLKDGCFICKLCKKGYNTKSKFIIHYRNHTGKNPLLVISAQRHSLRNLI